MGRVLDQPDPNTHIKRAMSPVCSFGSHLSLSSLLFSSRSLVFLNPNPNLLESTQKQRNLGLNALILVSNHGSDAKIRMNTGNPCRFVESIRI